MNDRATGQTSLSSDPRTVVLAQLGDHDVHRILAQGEFVVTHSTIDNAVAFDLWHVVEGAIAEHWGDREPIVAVTANGHSQTDGATTVDESADTAAAQRLIEATVQTILIDNDFSSLDSYLAGEDYIQHNPRFADGISGLAAALSALAAQGITMKYRDRLQTVAEGDFVYTYSNGIFGGTDYVFHDLFRVADGLAVEHWDVMVPAK